MTCHNRKQKTLSCLQAMYKALDSCELEIESAVFLTDDGSDGTSQLIRKSFNERTIHFLQGNGHLYWAGGMRNSWKEAIKVGGFDGYLWLNDDTFVFENFFDQLFSADIYSKNRFQISGVYVGSTCDFSKSKHTYGGLMFKSKILNTGVKIIPTDKYQDCDIANGNIIYVAENVVQKIGIFHEGYTHGCADFGYTFLAKKHKIPLFVLPGYLGICDNDHIEKYEKFKNLNYHERMKFLYSPLGFQFHGNLLFQREFFLYRYPFVFFAGWFKVFFPKGYSRLNMFRSIAPLNK